METLIFYLSWLALAWLAARPLARNGANQFDNHEVLGFLVLWLVFSVLAAVPAFILAAIWPVTLIGLTGYAAYLFIPGAAPLFCRIEGKIQRYLDNV